MSWNFNSLSKSCYVSGKLFLEGDIVVCLVVKATSGEMVRVDVLEQNAGKLKFSGEILGFWRRVFQKNTNVSEDLTQKLMSIEDFFFSLYEAEPKDETAFFKQFIALYLEKHSLLKAVGVPRDGIQRFTHLKSRRSFDVPLCDPTPEQLARLASVINGVIF